jgi:hypothetical protein
VKKDKVVISRFVAVPPYGVTGVEGVQLASH